MDLTNAGVCDQMNQVVLLINYMWSLETDQPGWNIEVEDRNSKRFFEVTWLDLDFQMKWGSNNS